MRTTILLSLLLVLPACDRGREKERESMRVETESAKPAADNTEKNERDRQPGAMTPGDQGESEADREVTRLLREKVMEADGLSMNAQNIKIITKDGVVTLRGPVDSANEKGRIATLAQAVPGVKRVDNQLEIAAP